MRPGWREVFEIRAYRGFEAQAGLLVSFAREGHDEVLEDAIEALAANQAYFRSVGRSSGRVVLVADGMNSQSLPVRRYYAQHVGPDVYERVAIVGMSGFARALGTIFLGLHRPRGLELALFGDLDEALAWAAEGLS